MFGPPVAIERWSAVFYSVEVLLRPRRSSDVQIDGGSMVGSRLHSSPRPWR